MNPHTRVVESILALSRRDRRALALGGLAAVAMLTTTWGEPAYREWAAHVESDAIILTRARDEAQRARRPTAADRAVHDSAAARAARLVAYEPGLVPGASPAAAAAELGSELREFADDDNLEVGPIAVSMDSFVVASASVGEDGARDRATPGGSIGSTAAAAHGTSRPMPSSYVLVRATMEGTGVLGAVTAVLEDVEAGPHRLRVRELAIDPTSSTSTSVGGPAPFGPATAAVGGAAGTEGEPRLRLRIVVEGLTHSLTARTGEPSNRATASIRGAP